MTEGKMTIALIEGEDTEWKCLGMKKFVQTGFVIFPGEDYRVGEMVQLKSPNVFLRVCGQLRP